MTMKKSLFVFVFIFIFTGIAWGEQISKQPAIMPIGPPWEDPVFFEDCPACPECPKTLNPFFAPTVSGSGNLTVPMAWINGRLVNGPWVLVYDGEIWRLEE